MSNRNKHRCARAQQGVASVPFRSDPIRSIPFRSGELALRSDTPPHGLDLEHSDLTEGLRVLGYILGADPGVGGETRTQNPRYVDGITRIIFVQEIRARAKASSYQKPDGLKHHTRV